MGNVAGTGRIDDVESAMVLSLAEAAALGARGAVVDAHRVGAEEAAQQQQALADAGAGGGGGAGGGAAPEALVVGGILSLTAAANIAADGALVALPAAVRLLPQAQRRLLTNSDLRQIQAATAAGAASGVGGAAFIGAMYQVAPGIPPAMLAGSEAPPPANPQPKGNILDPEVVAAAAGSGAWKACLDWMIKSYPLSSSVNTWAARLAPLLGASLGVAAILSPHFIGTTHWETFSVLGGVGLLLFTLMVGVAAVPFTDTMKPETVSRHATFVAFIIIIAIFVSFMCYQLRGNNAYLGPVAAIGFLAVGSLLYLWYRSGRYK